MSLEDQKNGAYWERNMLALYMGMYANEMWKQTVNLHKEMGDTDPSLNQPAPCGYYVHGEWEGWSRVISLFDGRVTFHVPDDFDLGDLPEIEPNWDGHSTEEKWKYVMMNCGVRQEEYMDKKYIAFAHSTQKAWTVQTMLDHAQKMYVDYDKWVGCRDKEYWTRIAKGIQGTVIEIVNGEAKILETFHKEWMDNEV